MVIEFYIRFSTRYGQTLHVSGDTDSLGGFAVNKAIPLHYFNQEFWHGAVDTGDEPLGEEIGYRYILRDDKGEDEVEWGNDRKIKVEKGLEQVVLVDTWNHAGEIENAFFTKPFTDILLHQATESKKEIPKKYTHEFRVKAPLLKANERICLLAEGIDEPCLMTRSGNWHITRMDISSQQIPFTYHYAVYNAADEKITIHETGGNRTLPPAGVTKKRTIVHDGFVHLPNNTWKGAGVAIPVFSLRSKNGFGTGEFTDIKLLTDWAKSVGLKMIQLLPVNDTTATHTIADSYPYAAISAFALHPIYLNLEKVAGKQHAGIIKALVKKQKQLDKARDVDYEQVMRFKQNALRELFELQKGTLKEDTVYFEFFEINRHWLVPYAAFCFLRDKYGTADFTKWKTNSRFDEDAIQKLASPSQKHYDEIAIHYFVQYHLHLQLKEATSYAHKNGIIVKGDIPIGVYRFGCDAWTDPGLYHMDSQAGAPPDDFAVKGQNWGFPTYNWQKMQEDGFSWWRKRFEQMSEYFDAFRIDHILGFFRIWSIPLDSVEGIMGRFVPAIPVDITEFQNRNIFFDHHRYCRPFINDQVLDELFGADAAYIKEHFLDQDNGTYQLKEEFNTQRKLQLAFSNGHNGHKQYIKEGLYYLCSNVILFEEEGSNGRKFHFRIAMEQTSSYNWLNEHTKQQLKELYVNYFYHRQDDFWKKEALHKLPGLKSSTNMLVCGEDLGMVPHCVPEVMQQLGMLSLEIQRMPKKLGSEFFHPNDAPYMSVVTPSTHDMSTIRGWWEEDIAKTQRFYNQMLGHYGAAPYYCEPWISKAIIVQHLYSPAMWAIFQLQDLLGMDKDIRRQNPAEERINIPANPNHHWVYRMHLSLEELIKQKEFNEGLKDEITKSGR